ncbi:hypothetical protein PLICRDRAFT_114620 [Plicaturopsis crispa FD-325 SS-3]|nr:hypothetical protein PLICRDRAFT_114620 [Plicaturopsis crispa FD-325 SS-3]
MLFYRKSQSLVKGKAPLHTAASPTAPRRHGLVARCIMHGRMRTYRWLPAFRGDAMKRPYSTRNTGAGPDTKGVPFYRRLLNAWTETPTIWYPIPLAVGALLLVAVQFRKKLKREVHVDEEGREVIKLKGPWQVHVLGALPLRNLSRVWGYMNSLELPVWFRPYGFRLYAYAFGCNLEEVEHADLREYKSLGDFFYRKLKDGARPVDAAILASLLYCRSRTPADGKMLHFGTIQDLRVEQVKGITYSLDALLGVDRDDIIPSSPTSSSSTTIFDHNDMEVVNDREFANVNGIEYSLDQLIGHASRTSTPGTTTPTSDQKPDDTPRRDGEQVDASVVEPSANLQDTIAHDASVAIEMGVRQSLERKRSTSGTSVKEGNALYFAVIYLAPGDYHRFHSPTAWVVEKRRHFVGELFSVSPYMAKRLENLFVLNERVALLGRWKHGFFGMVPVGATNVGSIKINFDQALRTNVRGRPPPPGTYSEAVYSAASPILNGQPLTPAQEMGGFCLGSTIVLVFEAPETFEFAVAAGEKVKVGQKLGDVVAKEG